MNKQPAPQQLAVALAGVQPPVTTTAVEVQVSNVRISWDYDRSVNITEFVLTKSEDMGLTYAALATVPYSTSGANYDKTSRRFFYDDADGEPGHVYKVVSSGALGSSAPALTIVPPESPGACLVVGYLIDSAGQPDSNVAVHVELYGARGGKWLQNSPGVVAHNGEAIGVVSSPMIVFADASGLWQVPLLRKSLARITIHELSFEWAFEVPDREGPVNVRDIPQLRGGDFYGVFGEHGGVPNPITPG